MKLDSEYFDAIRVGKTKGKGKTDGKARAGAARAQTETPECAWQGCDKPGTHKAPLGRDREGQYVHFCMEHVRQYNKSYNYFSGLDDTEIQSYLKDSLTGHRPTWDMGRNNSGSPEQATTARPTGRNRRWGERLNDSHGVFAGADGTARAHQPQRKVRSLEAKALRTLDLGEDATGEVIRLRYKERVKQLHPDANGGDRGTEDKLREVIQAYKLLQRSGFC